MKSTQLPLLGKRLTRRELILWVILITSLVWGVVVFALLLLSLGSEGFLIKGNLAKETINQASTPDTSQVEAEVSLLETTASPDRKTLRVGISILNTGQSAFTVKTANIHFLPENGLPSAPLSAEPALPFEIKAGASETFSFTFPKPSSGAVTLQIFDIKFDLDY